VGEGFGEGRRKTKEKGEEMSSKSRALKDKMLKEKDYWTVDKNVVHGSTIYPVRHARISESYSTGKDKKVRRL
jgi:hypothetical protein